MEILYDTKIEILNINLAALSDDDRRHGLIIIDENTYNIWINYLVKEERYEECKILKDNKQLFVKN